MESKKADSYRIQESASGWLIHFFKGAALYNSTQSFLACFLAYNRYHMVINHFQ